VSFEAEARRDERSRTSRPKTESPRDATNGVVGGVPAPDRPENFCDHASDARRGVLSDCQQDVDVSRGALSVPPEIVIDVLAEDPVSALRLVLGLSHTTIGSEGQRIPVGSPWFGPAAGTAESFFVV